jgi:hypothetical protein
MEYLQCVRYVVTKELRYFLAYTVLRTGKGSKFYCINMFMQQIFNTIWKKQLCYVMFMAMLGV